MGTVVGGRRREDFVKYSFEFDGTDEFFSGSTTYSELDGLENVAFSFWIKPKNSGTNAIVLSIGTANADTRASQFQIIRNATNGIQFYMTNLSYGGRSNDDVIIQDEWNHVLVTRDDLRGPGEKLKFFVNGVDESFSDGTRFAPSSNANTGLWIGEHQNGFNAPFLGGIDEVAIYNQDMVSYINEIYGGGFIIELNQIDTKPINWFRMGELSQLNGTQWTMTDVNGGYTVLSESMDGNNRVLDIP